MQRHRLYAYSSLLKKLSWILLLILGCKCSQGIAFAVMLPLACMWILSGKNDKAMLALLIATSFMMINTFFVPKNVAFYIVQKLLILGFASIMIIRLSGMRKLAIVAPTLLLFPYLVYITCTSQIGWCPIISNFKLFLFVMTYLAFYGTATLCSDHSSSSIPMRESILCMAILFIIGSVLLIPFPGISYMGTADFIEQGLSDPSSTVTLFKGFAKHSQTLGPTVAMLVVLIFADWVFSIQRKDLLYLSLVLLGPYVIYRTSSRTAMGSMIAGVGFIVFFAMQARGGLRSWRRKVVNVTMLLVVVLSSAVCLVPAGREKVAKFVVKSYSGETTLQKEVILGSRQSKLDEAMANWRKSPIIGNGFQVSENMSGIRINDYRDILTAPVEKSTWTYAILEEGGVIGLALFVFFIVAALYQMIRLRAYTGASVLFTMIVSNLGEFGIFSMSNQGGFYWALVFSALVMDSIRIREERVYGQNFLRYP